MKGSLSPAVLAIGETAMTAPLSPYSDGEKGQIPAYSLPLRCWTIMKVS